MNQKKLFSLLIIFILFAIFGTASAQDFEPVDLVVWVQDEQTGNLLATLFDEWQVNFSPGSTIDVQLFEDAELRSELLAVSPGELPNLIVDVSDPIALYAYGGLLTAFDGLIDTSIYDDRTLRSGQVEGFTFGIPLYSGNHLMLMYNTSLVSSPPQTFDELLQLAGQVGLVLPVDDPYWLVPFVLGFGGEVLDSSGNITVNTDSWIQAYTAMRQLADVVPSGCDYECADRAFREGDAGMMINGDWALPDYRDSSQSPALGNNLAIAPWFTLPNGQRAVPYISGKYLSIPVTTTGTDFEAALAFAVWASTDASVVLNTAESWGYLPAVSSLQSDAVSGDAVLSASLDVFDTGVVMPASPRLRCAWDSIAPHLEAVLNDSLSPGDAAFGSQQAAEECAATLQ